MISGLTYKILACSASPGYPMDDVVDWAVEMMQLGYESENLYILAGLTKPILYAETAGYLRSTLSDLGFKELSGDDAKLSYASYYVRLLSKGEDVRQHLKNIFNHPFDIFDCTYNFRLLYWAWEDFDYGLTFSCEWPDATPATIEQETINTAREWLAENENRLNSFIIQH